MILIDSKAWIYTSIHSPGNEIGKSAQKWFARFDAQTLRSESTKRLWRYPWRLTFLFSSWFCQQRLLESPNSIYEKKSSIIFAATIWNHHFPSVKFWIETCSFVWKVLSWGVKCEAGFILMQDCTGDSCGRIFQGKQLPSPMPPIPSLYMPLGMGEARKHKNGCANIKPGPPSQYTCKDRLSQVWGFQC